MRRALVFPVFFLAGACLARAELPPAEPNLWEFVSEALANNPVTRERWAQAKAAAAGVGSAQAAYYPTLSFRGIVGYEYYQEPDFPGYKTVSQFAAGPGLVLSFLLLDFGGRAAKVAEAQALLAAAHSDYNQVLQETILAVETAYYAAAAAAAQVRQAEADRDWARERLESLRTGLGAGLAIPTGILTAEAAYAQSERELQAARSALAAAHGKLNAAAGAPANRPIRPGPLPRRHPVKLLDDGVDHLIRTSLASRPALAARFAEVRARDAVIRQVESTYWPTVTFEGVAENLWYAARAKNIPIAPQPFNESGEDRLLGAAVKIEWDLFDGFYRQNEVARARAEAEAARASLRAAELAVVQEVWDGYHDYLTATRDLLYREAALRASRSLTEIAREGFTTGLVNLVERYQAERDDRAAQAAEVSARAAWLTAAARLVYATGQLTPGLARETTTGP